jgi:hypothetical protein
MTLGMASRALLLVVLVPYALWLVFAYEYHFLDGANLLFHEAGHVFFGLLGHHLGILGGTLMQYVFPAAAGLHFLRSGRPFEAWVCVFWAGENLMYTAVYMSDAIDQVLPRVGGEIHDWHWLFTRWGWLAHHRGIGAFTHVLGSLVVVGSLAAAGHGLLREREDAELATQASASKPASAEGARSEA